MRILFVSALFVCVLSHLSAQDRDRPSQPDLPGDLMLDFGYNLWSAEIDSLPLRFIGSNSIGLYYNKRFRISNRISFYSALGFTFEKFGFDDEFTWLRDATGAISIDTLAGTSMRKNKLSSTYIEIPIEFRIHPFGTVVGEGFFIGLGAIGGINIDNHSKIKYDIGDATRKEKLYSDFGVNRIRYGLQARFGFRSVHLFYKTYLNEYFESPPTGSGVSPKVWTIGVNFSGF